MRVPAAVDRVLLRRRTERGQDTFGLGDQGLRVRAALLEPVDDMLRRLREQRLPLAGALRPGGGHANAEIQLSLEALVQPVQRPGGRVQLSLQLVELGLLTHWGALPFETVCYISGWFA